MNNQQTFIAIDGDDVGSHLEYFILTNNLSELGKFSEQYSVAMEWLQTQLVKGFNADIIFSGGDNLFASIKQEHFDLSRLRELHSQYFSKASRTLSIGLGYNSRTAYLALKLAKTSGKNCIKDIRELENE